MPNPEVLHLHEIITRDLHLPEGFSRSAMRKAHTHVKRFQIKKRSGGSRLISHPPRELKTLQYWLIQNIFNKMPVHSAATAYVSGSSILRNAEVHAHNKYFLHLDFLDFFPSITASDLMARIKNWHQAADVKWEWNRDAIELVTTACFDKFGRLPQGYPSSPVISNIVMYDFDLAVTSLITGKTNTFGQPTYTRYADDISLSTNLAGGCAEMYKDIEGLVKSYASPKLTLHKGKTRFQSSSGGSAIVTGIRICDDHHLTLHKTYKDHVRLLLKLFSQGRLKLDELNSLKGHIAYIRFSDPAFLTKLQSKYYAEIAFLEKQTG